MGLVSEDGHDWVSHMAGYLGASGPALRLLISVLMAYPFAVFHRTFLYRKEPMVQHLFFIVAGSYIGYFNYGDAIIHAYICILVNYLVICVGRGGLVGTVFLFIFQMIYLLTEYYLTETAMYDIKWTIPHCVLTLRLIGQAIDVFDGTQKEEKLSKGQKETALKRIPTLLEVSAHIFYPGSFMIGPQFPLRRYLNFVNGEYSPAGEVPASMMPGIRRLLIGLFYVGIYQLGSLVVNNDFITSDLYRSYPFWQRMLIVGIYGKVMLYKYVSCWIVGEGACIMAGIAYNGKTETGVDRWDGCENINISVFERSYKFGHIIASFNKCTNIWVAENVYKRLKFVGNRYVSQLSALLFLAVWHGLHSGYYMCFFMEFLVMKMEKDLEKMVEKNPRIQRWHSHPIGFWIDVVVLKVIVTVFFGYCTLSFGFLKMEKWWEVYQDLYFSGCLIFGLWPLYAPLVKLLLVPTSRGSPGEAPSVNGGMKQD